MIIDDPFNAANSECNITELVQELKQKGAGNGDRTTLAAGVIDSLQSPATQLYFRHNLSEHCEVLALLIEETNEDQFIYLLKNKEVFTKFLVARNDFQKEFFATLLLPLVKNVIKFEGNTKIVEATSKLVRKCIFNNNFTSFQCYLGGHSKSVCSDNHSICKTLIKSLTQIYEFNGQEASCGFKLIFDSFCKAYNNFELIYKMFVIIVEILGFQVKEQFNLNKIVKAPVPDVSLPKSLEVLSEIFGVVATLKTYPNCSINDISFADFVQNLLKSVLGSCKFPNRQCYQLVAKTIEINPLIIESLITEIITFSMLADNRELAREYEDVMIKMFEVFSKLRRVQNLVSVMIGVSQSNLVDRYIKIHYEFRGKSEIRESTVFEFDVDLALSPKILSFFTTCLVNLTSWQVVDLFKTLVFHLAEGLEEFPEGEEDSKLIFVEVLSTLTCCLLSTVRIAEHTVTSEVVAKFVWSLEDLRTLLGRFGTILLHREHNHALMNSFLNVCYNWAEIYMVIACYSTSDEMKLKTTIDNDFSSCNLVYLHSYLSGEQWCLIAERISNFGEKPCKEIMQKLYVQKLRAALLFGAETREEMVGPIVKTLSENFDEDCMEIFVDKFVVNNILPKTPTSFLIKLSEVLLKKLTTGAPIKQHIYDSQLMTNGSVCVIFSKIAKLLKQKRKHDEATVKKTLFARIVAILPENVFLDGGIEESFPKIVEILANEQESRIDLKINSEQITSYLEVLRKLPVIFCPENARKLLLLALFGLHRDIRGSNCEIDVTTTCENIVIGIAQNSKFTFLDVVEAQFLVRLIVNNFVKFDNLLSCFVDNVFKSNEAIEQFRPGVEYLTKNLKDPRCLKCGVIILNHATKARKSKISAEAKGLCVQYQSAIYAKIVKLSKRPGDHLVEPYALALKHFVSQGPSESLEALKTHLNDYTEFCFTNLCKDNLKGVLLLLSTVLHNKSTLGDIKDDFTLRVWNSLKTVTVASEIVDDYSQLIVLTTSLIPGEQFSNITTDLLEITESSINAGNFGDLFNHLRTWGGILSSNFNPVKTGILQEALECLSRSLITATKHYNKPLFEEITEFLVLIIRTRQLPLTPAILDLLILDVSVLMSAATGANFVDIFNLSIKVMDNLLKHRNALIMDRLPPYLQQYRVLLKELGAQSNSDLGLGQNDVQKLADCAQLLERITQSLVLNVKDVMRISPYLMADILAVYEAVTLYPAVKLHLNNCMYSLMSLYDQHAVAYLMRVLSDASTEIFKIMYDNYKKYYRFTGKV